MLRDPTGGKRTRTLRNAKDGRSSAANRKKTDSLDASNFSPLDASCPACAEGAEDWGLDRVCDAGHMYPMCCYTHACISLASHPGSPVMRHAASRE